MARIIASGPNFFGSNRKPGARCDHTIGGRFLCLPWVLSPKRSRPTSSSAGIEPNGGATGEQAFIAQARIAEHAHILRGGGASASPQKSRAVASIMP